MHIAWRSWVAIAAQQARRSPHAGDAPLLSLHATARIDPAAARMHVSLGRAIGEERTLAAMKNG